MIDEADNQAQVRHIVSEYDNLIYRLQYIARRVLQLRLETTLPGQLPGYVPRDSSDYGITIIDDVVSTAYYYRQNDHSFEFPLSYAWHDNWEACETQAMTDRQAAEAARKAKRESDDVLSAEAHDRELYTRLKKRFEGYE